jgi:hypothetical protein
MSETQQIELLRSTIKNLEGSIVALRKTIAEKDKMLDPLHRTIEAQKGTIEIQRQRIVSMERGA